MPFVWNVLFIFHTTNISNIFATFVQYWIEFWIFSTLFVQLFHENKKKSYEMYMKKEFTHSSLTVGVERILCRYVGFCYYQRFIVVPLSCIVDIESMNVVSLYDNNDRVIIIINKFTPFLFICITFFQLIYVVLWIIIAAETSTLNVFGQNQNGIQ